MLCLEGVKGNGYLFCCLLNTIEQKAGFEQESANKIASGCRSRDEGKRRKTLILTLQPDTNGSKSLPLSGGFLSGSKPRKADL